MSTTRTNGRITAILSHLQNAIKHGERNSRTLFVGSLNDLRNTLSNNDMSDLVDEIDALLKKVSDRANKKEPTMNFLTPLLAMETELEK